MTRIDTTSLTQLQLDGITCAVCGQLDERPMIPVGPAPSGLVDLYAHEGCVMAAPKAVLVVGKVETADDVADLTALAFDVADRLQLPAEVAVSMSYDVADYDCVVLADNWLDSTASVVLGVEAQQRDMCVLDVDALYVYESDTVCGHCHTVDETAAPRRSDVGWTTSVCSGCVEAHARMILPGVLPLAA
ncbi:hypothetical protein ACIBL8_08285 [Streptomyces sp. NPDC050523]|uniref:hypothetical protein n=1 Tax=Streptomyces sp. NPDC050523 TaxID=3365622 RepID=UPI0037B3CD94